MGRGKGASGGAGSDAAGEGPNDNPDGATSSTPDEAPASERDDAAGARKATESAEPAPIATADGDPTPDPVRRARARGPKPSRWAALPLATRALFAAAGAFVLALVLRLPARDLPIEGDAVAYGALAQSLAHGEGYTIDGVAHDRYPPAWPAVLSIPVALGSSVTSAVRGTAWVLGALAAALLVLLGVRWTGGRVSLGLLALLAAAHPDFALFAGGLVPASEALALVIVLSLALLAGDERPAARWSFLGLAALLPLVRYDALPFSVVSAVLAWRATSGGRRSRARKAIDVGVVALPLLLWSVRTWIVSGVPWGRGYEGHGLSLSRLPMNVLVLAGLLVPVAGLGLLLPFVPRGIAAIRRAAERRAAVAPLLVAAVAHVALVLVFAGPTGAGERSLRFLSTGSLRFGILAVPFLLLAGLAGLASEKEKLRRIVAVALGATAVPLALYLVSGGLQRMLPVGPRAAARLHVLAEAYDAAVADAATDDWIGLDLEPRDNEGVTVFVGDRAQGRRSGVFVRSPSASRAGLFPAEPLLPFDRGLPRDAQIVVVSDVAREGLVFTGDREFVTGGARRRVGGPGIFARATLKEVDGGTAGVYRIDSVRRAGR